MHTRIPSDSRRRFLGLAAGAAVAASGLPMTRVRAAALPRLAETDPAAQARGGRGNTREVSSAKYPKHQPSQECGNCNFYRGPSGAEWGPGLIFPGKDVHVGGWCMEYTPKA